MEKEYTAYFKISVAADTDEVAEQKLHKLFDRLGAVNTDDLDLYWDDVEWQEV
jgi:hypothetical protein